MKCLKKSISKAKAILLLTAFTASGFLYADTSYVVQKGDTLYSISRTYKVSVAEICSVNNIADGASIKVGQKLTIPEAGKTASKKDEGNSSKSSASTASSQSATSTVSTASKASSNTYEVQKGETWYGISRKYGISVNDLLGLNGVKEGASLKAGQKIKVPQDLPSDATTAKIAQADKSSGSGKVVSGSGSAGNGNSSSKTTVPDLKGNDPRNYSDKKGDSSLVWPVKAPAVTYVNGKVSGVNLSAKKDESVSAIRSGTVMFSGLYRGFGNVVFVQSKTGHIYAYTGLGTVKVGKGEYITYGQQLGTAGIDNYSEKPQISLMVFQNGLPIDPAKAPRG